MKPNDTYPNPAQGLSFSQQALSQYNQHRYQQLLVPTPMELVEELYLSRTQWMWAGQHCTIEQFAELAYGDTAERTHFLLQYKDML